LSSLVTTNDGKYPTTSATPSASSPPVATPQDVDSAVLVVSSDHAKVTHPNCSTPGLHQVATILVPATAFSASSTCTTTSTPLLDVPIANPTAATELILMEHTRCLALGLYQYARVPMVGITSSALVPASSATAPDQDTKLDIPAAAAEHLSVQRVGCLTSARNLGGTSQKSMLTLAIGPTSTTAISVFHYISINPVLSIGVDQLSFNTSAGDTCEVFEVTPHASYTSSCDYCKSVELCHP
jgi:hypothetical protein